MLREEDIIGSTTFLYKGQKAEISLYRPTKKWQESDEFSCRFSIKGHTISHSDEVVGYDSMQSIILSLSYIGYYLRESDKIDQEYIEWPGGKLEFPEL